MLNWKNKGADRKFLCCSNRQGKEKDANMKYLHHFNQPSKSIIELPGSYAIIYLSSSISCTSSPDLSVYLMAAVKCLKCQFESAFLTFEIHFAHCNTNGNSAAAVVSTFSNICKSKFEFSLFKYTQITYLYSKLGLSRELV